MDVVRRRSPRRAFSVPPPGLSPAAGPFSGRSASRGYASVVAATGPIVWVT